MTQADSVNRPGNPAVVDRRPLMFMTNGEPEMNFSRGSLLYTPSSKRSPNLPKLSEKQAQALEWVHFSALKHVLRLCYNEGDLIVFNNRKVLHGRDEFKDQTAQAEAGTIKSRHFLRLWLGDRDLAGPPPAGLEKRWSILFDPRKLVDEASDWPLEPISKKAEAIPARHALANSEAPESGI